MKPSPLAIQDWPGLLPADLGQQLNEGLLALFTRPYEKNFVRDAIQRDKDTLWADLYLSSCAWDFWDDLSIARSSTAQTLIRFWEATPQAKAILILDALSLRELPFLLQGAAENGVAIAQVATTTAEIPADTTPFAKALGFSQRSALADSSTPPSHLLFPSAKTQAGGMPFADCISLITPDPNWIFWHHSLDDRLHELSQPDGGIEKVLVEAHHLFHSKDFWDFVKALARGRELVITSDHGYAATGLFPDTEGEEASHLRDVFKARRNTSDTLLGAEKEFLPPIALRLEGSAEAHRLVLGRRKWKVPGGYPTLAHGGLTLLETFVPYLKVKPL